MRRFAANRIYLSRTKTMLRNQVVEMDEASHEVKSVFALEGEIRHTEWLGGLIMVAAELPERQSGECFAAFLKRVESFTLASTSALHAYHVTAFDVHALEFTKDSRIIAL